MNCCNNDFRQGRECPACRISNLDRAVPGYGFIIACSLTVIITLAVLYVKT